MKKNPVNLIPGRIFPCIQEKRKYIDLPPKTKEKEMQKRSIVVKHILTFITCGIYNLFWMYLARSEFKHFSGYSDINPGLELVLNILCFPFYFYWLYKFSADIARYQQENGRYVSDTGLVNLLLAFFGFGIVCPFIIQSQLNDLLD